MPSRADSEPTVAVDEVLPDFADAFPFERFNEMQSAALPALLNREDNAVVSAPTASGKTALAELAICETLKNDGIVSVGEFSVLNDVQVICESCGRSHEVTSFLEQGGCGCEGE